MSDNASFNTERSHSPACTFAAGLMARDTGRTGARGVSRGLLTFHTMGTMLARL